MLLRKLILLFYLSTFSFSLEIQPLTEHIEPWQIKEDNKLSGMGIDVVKEIQKRIGNKKKIKMFPWNRVYNMCLKKEGYAIFSTSRTKKREKLFKWVGPLYSNEIVFFKHKDNKKIYKTLADARGAKLIAVVKNDVTEQILQEKNFKNLNIYFGDSSQINLKKLLDKKIELIPAGKISSAYKIKKLSLEDKIIETKIPSLISNELYIAFNINTDDKTIKKWQNALDEIKKEGLYTKIINKYK